VTEEDAFHIRDQVNKENIDDRQKKEILQAIDAIKQLQQYPGPSLTPKLAKVISHTSFDTLNKIGEEVVDIRKAALKKINTHLDISMHNTRTVQGIQVTMRES
jgi:ribosomal 50S subunit-associated protein YjgA (DUF615 family)